MITRRFSLGLLLFTSLCLAFFKLALAAGPVSTAPGTKNLLDKQREDREVAELESQKLTGSALKKFFAYKPGERYYGVDPTSAKVVVVFYISPTCPHCSHSILKTIPHLKHKYLGLTPPKQVSIIVRNFVSDSAAMTAIMLLQCKTMDLDKSSDKQDRLMRTIYSTQNTWVLSNNIIKSFSEILDPYAFTMEKIVECMNDKVTQDRLLKERVDVITKGGLRGTPMVVINGEPLEDFSDVNIERTIERALIEIRTTTIVK